MRSSTIYQITVRYVESVRTITASEPHVTYYSNLKRTVEALQTTLVTQGWIDDQLSYSSVYRALNERGKFMMKLRLEGIGFMQLVVEKATLNPGFTTLGIDRKPTD